MNEQTTTEGGEFMEEITKYFTHPLAVKYVAWSNQNQKGRLFLGFDQTPVNQKHLWTRRIF